MRRSASRLVSALLLERPNSPLAPNELLEKIAYAVAPNGGRQAGNLRLTCRHLAGFVAPVVWASILFPQTSKAQLSLLNILLRERDRHSKSIKSLRYPIPIDDLAEAGFDAGYGYPRSLLDLNEDTDNLEVVYDLAATIFIQLPSLSRIHLGGDVYGDYANFEPQDVLPLALWVGLREMETLDSVIFDRLDLFRTMPDPAVHPLRPLDRPIKSLIVRQCLRASQLSGTDVLSAGVVRPVVPIATRVFRMGECFKVEYEVEYESADDEALILLIPCLASVEEVEIRWDAPRWSKVYDLITPCVCETAKSPPLAVQKLVLRGLPDLFKLADAVIAIDVARVLAVVTRGPLFELFPPRPRGLHRSSGALGPPPPERDHPPSFDG